MTAAGDAVLAEAQRWVGTTEWPPGSNAGPWWDPWGANYGSWCAAFVSMVVNNALGAGAMCAVDGAQGFMLVSNGVIHQYETPGDGITGLEAQRTPDLLPGDVVNYSWENWTFSGTPGASGSVPIILGGEYDGWVAGDHTGIVQSAPDGSGYFTAVEGNTSLTSDDNGGAVMVRTRHLSQVCGWWRPVTYRSSTPGSGPGPEEDEDVYKTCLVTTEGHPWKGSVFMCAGGRAVGMNDPNIVANLQARGLAGPTINVEAWDIYGGYEVVYPSGPGVVPA